MNYTIEKEKYEKLEKEIELFINEKLFQKQIIDEYTYEKAKKIIVSS